MKHQRFLFNLFLLITCVVGLTACLSQKYTKKGMEYEQNGLKSEAAEYYYQALVKKSNNIDARLGLKRTGQIVLDEKLEKFNDAYSSGNNTQAVEDYIKAQTYFDNLNHLGVELDFPTNYQQYFEEAKNVYLEEQYLLAMQMMQKENYAEAETIFRSILSLNSNYRDAREQLNIAICEPQYRVIVQWMEAKKFRGAYNKIATLQKTSFSYKDIQDLQKECLEKGSIIVVIPSFTANSNNKSVAQAMRLNVMRELQNLNDPFLKILESSNSGTSAGQTILLKGTVKSLNYDAGKLSKTETKGWLRKVTVNHETGESKTSYSKVYYHVYQQQRKISVDINYQMVDQRTGEVVKSNSEQFSTSDNVHYATFDGSKNDLVAGYWNNKINIFNSKEDRIDDNAASNFQLRQLLNANQKLKDYNALLEIVLNQSVKSMARDVQTYLSNE